MNANTRTFAVTLASVAALSQPSHPAHADTSTQSGCSHLRYSAVPFAARDGTALFADDLNDEGEIVCHIFDDNTATNEVILWKDGRYVRLGDRILAGALDTTATAVNNRTQIVGQFAGPDFNTEDYLLDRRGVTYLVGPFTSPQEINDHGVIAGTASSDGIDHGAVWSNGETVLLPMAPGAVSAIAADINNNGTVVGRAETSARLEALVWFAPYTSAPTVIPLPPNAERSQGARGVNNREQVIFAADDFDAVVTRSYLWSADRPLQELQPLAGLAHSVAVDINTDGLIVGSSASADQEAPSTATVWRGAEVCALEELVKTPPGLEGQWVAGFRVNERGEILAFRSGSSVGAGWFVLRTRK